MPNQIEDLVDRLQDEGRVDELETELAKIDLAGLGEQEAEAWHRFRGIAAFQRGDRAAALERFAAGLEACPDSTLMRFSLGQEVEHTGDSDRMIELFDGCRFPDVPANYALTQARYAYLWDRPDKVIEYVLPIADAYYDLRIADDHFLYMRGLPFFSVTWGTLGAAYELTDDMETFRQFTQTASEKLSDFAFEPLLAFIDAVVRDDFTDLLNSFDSHVAESGNQGFPVGLTKMQAAVIRSVKVEEVNGAIAVLDSVELADNDFPWLDDMRLLAHCRLAHLSGDADREKQLQDAFLARQPLLFEPEHMFNFRLLSYQERLKARYREAKVS